jgi:GNAT superfamily N-acetyltransferase
VGVQSAPTSYFTKDGKLKPDRKYPGAPKTRRKVDGSGERDGSLRCGAACSTEAPAAMLSQACCRKSKLKWPEGASQSGKIAWLRCFPASEPGYGFVDESTPELSIAVLPAYRGKGIGSRLLERLLQGVDAASLSCDPANPAWRLYVRLGFEPRPDGRTMLRNKSSIN